MCARWEFQASYGHRVGVGVSRENKFTCCQPKTCPGSHGVLINGALRGRKLTGWLVGRIGMMEKPNMLYQGYYLQRVTEETQLKVLRVSLCLMREPVVGSIHIKGWTIIKALEFGYWQSPRTLLGFGLALPPKSSSYRRICARTPYNLEEAVLHWTVHNQCLI